MEYNFINTIKLSCCVVLCFVLLGCKINLYSGLTEKEGNEILAILLDGQIQASKQTDKDRVVTIFVPTNDVSRAINLLTSYGYPKEKHASMGDIFTKDGLISSPIEEKARYTYSMSQELTATLSLIDGVIQARVHVVLPQEHDSLSDINYPSSASVFIKYTQELDLTGFIAKVKTLVGNSIEGLAIEKITVSLFPATRLTTDELLHSNPIIANSYKEDDNKLQQIIIYILIMILVIILSIGGYQLLSIAENRPKWLENILKIFKAKLK